MGHKWIEFTIGLMLVLIFFSTFDTLLRATVVIYPYLGIIAAALIFPLVLPLAILYNPDKVLQDTRRVIKCIRLFLTTLFARWPLHCFLG